MATGICKFWKNASGWGFITPDAGGSDVFCHVRELRATGMEVLKEGQQLQFDTEPGRDGKGPKAVNVKVA
jgi:CspA family cold shock protein